MGRLTEKDLFPNLRSLKDCDRERMTAQAMTLLRESPIVVTAEQIFHYEESGNLAKTHDPDDIHGVQSEANEWLCRNFVTR